jgi:HTH-type transcriptional regulator, sugar sensing transcriptional regulator
LSVLIDIDTKARHYVTMNDQQLISHIEDLGLSNKEARIYVACLSIGPSSVQRIADKSDIKRVTAYVILESLVGLGLVSQSVKGKKTYFIAEDPSNLRRLLEKREKELQEQRSSFEEVLPELSKLSAVTTEMPEVKFYEGLDGIRAMFADIFGKYKDSKNDIYSISNLDELHKSAPEREAKPNPDRVKNSIKSHIIYTSTNGPIYEGTDIEYNRESRFIPLDAYPVTGDINIIGDYVVLITLAGERPIGVSIRNTDMVRAMKTIFDMCWKISEQYL